MWIAWSAPLGRPVDTLVLRADAVAQSTVYFTPLNDLVQRQRPYALLGISADFEPRGAWWSIGAFVRNVTGESYITGSFGSPPPAFGGRPGEPRQIGVQLVVRR
jgi:outer membrane receptor protein involved in Fe transport